MSNKICKRSGDMGLDFRKYLTTFGITYEEYERMTEDKKQELINRFNQEQKVAKINKKAEGFKTAGEGIQGCGCIIILIPIAIALLWFIKSLIF